MPLGSCAPDPSGGSYNVRADWLDEIGSDGCPTDDNGWVMVRHYPSADCSGQTDTIVSSSASKGDPSGCLMQEISNGCFGLLRPGSECSESLLLAGWACHDDVMWAKNTGIHQHPEWYHGLTVSSSIEDFHRYVSQLPRCSQGQGPPCAANECSPPCYQSKPTCSISLSMGEQTDGGYGGGCHGSLGFEATENVCKPDGQGGSNMVSASSNSRYTACPQQSGVVRVSHFANSFCAGAADKSFSSFMDGQCMLGTCCNEDASRCDLGCHASGSPQTCHHVAPDSDCAGQLRWAMTEGVSNHPGWYTGLTAGSSVLDFQRYLSGMPMCADNGHSPPCYGASDPCPLPCP